MTVENSQVAENRANKKLAFGIRRHIMYPGMAKSPKRPAKVSFTPTARDYEIIQRGKEKHGANLTGIIRMALRRFAEAEGLELKAS